MSKWYEVEVKIAKTYLVEVEDYEGEDHVYDTINDEFRVRNYDSEAYELFTKEDIDNSKLHADEVLSL